MALDYFRNLLNARIGAAAMHIEENLELGDDPTFWEGYKCALLAVVEDLEETEQNQ